MNYVTRIKVNSLKNNIATIKYQQSKKSIIFKSKKCNYSSRILLEKICVSAQSCSHVVGALMIRKVQIVLIGLSFVPQGTRDRLLFCKILHFYEVFSLIYYPNSFTIFGVGLTNPHSYHLCHLSPSLHLVLDLSLAFLQIWPKIYKSPSSPLFPHYPSWMEKW